MLYQKCVTLDEIGYTHLVTLLSMHELYSCSAMLAASLLGFTLEECDILRKLKFSTQKELLAEILSLKFTGSVHL
jgi:uncharacterized protein (DUF1810 family)